MEKQGKDTTVRIDKNLAKQAKLKATEKDTTIKGYIESLIEKDLSKKQQQPQQ